MSTAMERLASRLGCTHGQAYSLVIMLVVGLVLGALGLPAALGDRPAQTRLTQPAPVQPQTPTSIAPAAPEPLVVGVSPLPLPPPAASVGAGQPDTATTAPHETSQSPADGGSFGQVFDFAAVPAPGAPAGIVAWGGGVDVATDNGPGRGSATQTPRVFRYSADGAVVTSFADRAVPTGSTRGISDLVVTADGVLLAVAPAQGALLRLTPGASDALVFGRVPDLPPCLVLSPLPPCEPGLLDNAPLPVAAGAAANGDVFVADAGQATIWRFAAAGGTPTPVHSHDDYTVDGELAGVAVDGAGKLVISATRSQGAGGGGALYVVDPASGGRAELATTGADSAPSGIAIGKTGRVYVALRGVGRVVVLARDGEEVARVPAAEQPAWDTPVDVAIRGESLLVTVQAPGDATKGRIVRVAVGEPTT